MCNPRVHFVFSQLKFKNRELVDSRSFEMNAQQPHRDWVLCWMDERYPRML